MQDYIDYINSMEGNILLGCDGFVDETYELVDIRNSPTDYIAVTKLKAFGELITSRADGGVGVELVPTRRCEGGFAINTGRIAACMGIKPKLPGLYGAAAIDPAFEPFMDMCDIHSIGDPGLTIVLEFQDGKLLMSNIQGISKLTWDDVKAHFGQARLKEMFTGVDLIGLGYWSLTSNFDDLFLGFMDQYESSEAPRRMIFDFADIKKKSNAQFTKSLELIKSYNSKIPMTLSVNEHEVLEVFNRLEVDCQDHTPQGITKALGAARQNMGLDEVIVHTPEFACGSSSRDGEAFAIQQRQTQIVRLAGAGDSFNGGYMCASLGELPLKHRLVMANAATAFFVTHGTGPTRGELIAQIEKAKDK